MECVQSKFRLEGNRRGIVLLAMLLIIVVIGVLVWFDPFALFSSSDPDLPWNQERRIFKRDAEVPAPSAEQASLTKNLLFKADVMEGDAKRGKIGMSLRPNGRIKGGWGGEYEPRPNVHYQVMGCEFKGNIDPSKIYKDDYGEDRSQLYFITKGKFIILETNSETRRVRAVKGHIYVTGWLDPEYKATGDVIITSDKRSYKGFSWQAKGEEGLLIFDLFQ